MHVHGTLQGNLNPARSWPKNTTKWFISLIIDVVDTPKQTVRHPVISPDLEKVLSVIQKGTEERLEVLKSKKKQVEEGESSVETVPKLIGHIEKMEEEEIEGEQEGDKAVAVEEVSGRQMANGGKVAAGEVGGRQMADRGTEQIEEMPKQGDKNKKADETEDLKKKPWSTPSINRLKAEQC